MTKTIGLADDAYERLATLRREGESFSDVVRRLTGAELFQRLAGTMDASTASHYRAVIRRGRRREDDARRKRVRKLAG